MHLIYICLNKKNCHCTVKSFDLSYNDPDWSVCLCWVTCLLLPPAPRPTASLLHSRLWNKSWTSQEITLAGCTVKGPVLGDFFFFFLYQTRATWESNLTYSLLITEQIVKREKLWLGKSSQTRHSTRRGDAARRVRRILPVSHGGQKVSTLKIYSSVNCATVWYKI